jgi:hypothetical protein
MSLPTEEPATSLLRSNAKRTVAGGRQQTLDWRGTKAQQRGLGNFEVQVAKER